MQAFMVTSKQSLLSVAIASCALAGCVLFEPEKRPCRDSEEFCQALDSGIGGPAGHGGSGGTDTGGSGGSGGSSGEGGDSGVTGGSGGAGGDSGSGAAGGGGSGGMDILACDDCAANELCDGSRGVCVDCFDDDDCNGDKPVCLDDECVGCVEDDDCPSASPACDTEAHECVECLDNDDCETDTPLCDEDARACVQCLEDADCGDASASRCDAGVCQPCTESTQCQHLEDTTVCDTSGATGVCVQCTGSSYEACGTAPGGTPYVCQIETKTCTTVQQGSALACQPCIANAHCRTGTVCMQTKFGSAETGNFCLWRQDATGTGTPNGNCGTFREFIASEDEWTSIEGSSATVCRPRTTTCQAFNDFSSKTCSGPTVTGHAQCGAAEVEDAYCAPFGDGGQHRCTIPCTSFDDCDNTRPGPDSDTECQPQTLGSIDLDVCQFE